MNSAIEYALEKLIKELQEIPDPTEETELILAMAKREREIFDLFSSLSLLTAGMKIDEIKDYFSNGDFVYLTNQDIKGLKRYKRLLALLESEE